MPVRIKISIISNHRSSHDTISDFMTRILRAC